MLRRGSRMTGGHPFGFAVAVYDVSHRTRRRLILSELLPPEQPRIFDATAAYLLRSVSIELSPSRYTLHALSFSGSSQTPLRIQRIMLGHLIRSNGEAEQLARGEPSPRRRHSKNEKIPTHGR